MNSLDTKIDAVNQLKGIAKHVGSKSINGKVDVNEDYEDEVYTSKHFVYGTLIVTCWREFIRIKEREETQIGAEENL
jgi:hypothetical protein